MSSTGRSPRGGDGHDNFPTPESVTQRLLSHVPLPGGFWLEPTAGEGAIIEAVNEVRSDVRWGAFELRPECKVPLERLGVMVKIGDARALLAEEEEGWDVAILNPPFSLAMPIILGCLRVAKHVVALERLNFLETRKRAAFFRAHAPDVYVFPDRPSFTGDGHTDSTAYAWFVWPEGGHNRSSGRVEVLPVETT